jgi:hypothetical protein
MNFRKYKLLTGNYCETLFGMYAAYKASTTDNGRKNIYNIIQIYIITSMFSMIAYIYCIIACFILK